MTSDSSPSQPQPVHTAETEDQNVSGGETPDSDEERVEAHSEDVPDILTTDVIFTRILVTADDEFRRSKRLLFLSGLAAGLSMSLSFMGTAVLKGALPPGSSAVVALLYPLGFVFTVLGRYQLFTENTLAPVTLVLARTASIPKLLYIWGLVLGANVLGTAMAAFYFAHTKIFDPEVAVAALELGNHLLEFSWATLFYKGTIAGWLVAGMVWLNHAARTASARMLIIVLLMYTVSAADLAHCIVGSSEVLYLVFRGEATLLEFIWNFLIPATLGNTAGGVLLVALLNYAQTQEEGLPDRDILTWRELFFGEREEEAL